MLGASSKWFFDWVTALRGEAVDQRRKVEDERLRFAASADELHARLLAAKPGRTDERVREALFEATGGVTRLTGIGDIRGATRATSWLICITIEKALGADQVIGTEWEDSLVKAKADFLLHTKEPLPRWSRHLKGPTDWRRNRGRFRHSGWRRP